MLPRLTRITATTLVNTIRGQDHTTYILEMTSQAWLTTNEVDRPIWKHWMTIVRPDAVASSKALAVHRRRRQ